MTKGDHVIELIGEMAVQSTQQVIDSEKKLLTEISRLDTKIDRVETNLKKEMQGLRNENSKFHDEIIGYLKRAEQERHFMSEHLKNHDIRLTKLEKKCV